MALSYNVICLATAYVVLQVVFISLMNINSIAVSTLLTNFFSIYILLYVIPRMILLGQFHSNYIHFCRLLCRNSYGL